MAKSRLDIQALLEELLGTENVYFQAPPSVKMSYPCIVYSLNNIRSKFASNSLYAHLDRYNVIAIHKDPDSDIPIKLLSLSNSAFDRRYVSDGLNHTSFNIYF